jgi:protein SCO1/2
MTRRVLWLIVAAALLAFAATATFVVLNHQEGAPPADTAGLPGGPFQMVDQDGRPVTEATLKGRPSVLFFGFTYCPDICPTTLTDLTRWMRALGRRADRLNVVFVSVDPERDTPAQLKSYLSAFDPRIRAFTGTPEQVASMAKAYKAYYQKVSLEGGSYTMDHASTLFLFDGNGRFAELIPYGAGDDQALPALERLLK